MTGAPDPTIRDVGARPRRFAFCTSLATRSDILFKRARQLTGRLGVPRSRMVQRGPHHVLVAQEGGVYAGLHASWVAQQGR